MVKQRENDFLNKYKQENLAELRYLGVKAIPVGNIKGSVNRWREFDQRFRPENADRTKYHSILKAIENDIVFPPISVYKIKENFYVIDGNHRVAAAKQMGQIDIDAEITELMPAADTLEHLLWREKSKFEWITGLSLNFSEIGSYERLLVYIRLFAKQINNKATEKFSLKEAAAQWYNEVYLPLTKMIKREGLISQFNLHTIDDLFLYILHHQVVKSRLQGRKVVLKEAVDDFIIKPGSISEKITRLFKGFVYQNKCERLCLACVHQCPDGLICHEDGRLTISDRCEGCGRCTDGCPNANPTAYAELASDPTEPLLKQNRMSS